LKKQKCGGFSFKIFEPKMSIRSTDIALAGNLEIGPIPIHPPTKGYRNNKTI